MAELSVIIPIYKVEKYLEKCLDSVLAQTFKDFEVICVNDGSPDKCGEILLKYAQQDKRIKIITQKNQGVSVARNTGLKAAKGNYVAFVDSDDMLSFTFLEKMYQVLKNTKADIVSCDVYQGNLEPSWGEQKVSLEQYDRPFEGYIQGRLKTYASIWGKLYTKKVVSNLVFEKSISQAGEDLLYLYQALYQAKKMVVISEKLYFYRNRPNSVMTSELSERFVLGNMRTAGLIYSYFNDKNLTLLTRKILNQKIAKRMFKFAVLEPKRKDKKNLKQWYLITKPFLRQMVRLNFYHPRYLNLKNRFKSWLFLIRLNSLFDYKLKIQKLQLKFFGITVSFKYNKILNTVLRRIKEKRRCVLLKNNEKIRVGFLVTECSKWGYQSVYDLFKKMPGYEPVILISKTFIEHIGRPNCGHSFQDCKDFFTKKRMPFEIVYDEVKNRPIPLNEFNIGILFYQQPWDVANAHHPYRVSQYALTCYISYGFELIHSAFSYTEGFNRWLDFNFLMTQENLDEIKKNISDAKNCILTGSPKLDVYHDIKKIKNDKPVVIYAPHHSFDLRWLNLATFQKNGKQILELAQKTHNKIHWVFKPHPLFKFSVLLNKVMSKSEIENYYAQWEKLGTIYEKGDYISLFKNSDALITDCCSFLAEYLPSKNPVFHLINEGCHWNKLANSFIHTYYTSKSYEQFEKDFMEVILKENDYKKKERLKKIPLVYDESKSAAEKMYQAIEKFLRRIK